MVDHAQGWQGSQLARTVLLGDPRHTQSFGAIDVRSHAPDPVVAKIEDPSVRHLDRCAAAPPASDLPTHHEHTVAEIVELLGDQLELLPDLAHGGDESFDAFAPLVAAALIDPCNSRPPLEVRGQQLGEKAIDVAAVESINRSLGSVHSVSRHTCRSIAKRLTRRSVGVDKRRIHSAGDSTTRLDNAEGWHGIGSGP